MNKSKEELPTFQEFAFETPLYKEYSLGNFIDELTNTYDYYGLNKYLFSIINPKKGCDAYCVDCRKESFFRNYNTINSSKIKFGNEIPGRIQKPQADNLYVVKLICSRDSQHKLFFIFRLKELYISKIGQHYSIAYLNIHRIKKYRKLLGDDIYKELSRAVGLASHGVGIGSFVYLRRIFEFLIDKTYEESKHKIDSTDFELKRMDEKIKFLKNSLPDALVENSMIYSILSKGIHNLTEDECLKNYELLENSIELILDEKLSQINKDKKKEKIKKEISNLSQNLKSK